MLAAFAQETGADIQFLISGTREVATTSRSRSKEPALRDIPIIGFAVASPEDDGYFDDMGFPAGVGESYIPWPTRDPNAYALRVKNDSMTPRIRPGEIIVVEPGASVSPGDDVLVRTRAGRKMVKQLLFRRGEEVTLGSINIAHKQVTLGAEEIESIHLIGGIVPRGVGTKEPGGS